MCSLLRLWEHYQIFPVLFCHFPAKYNTTWQNQEKITWKMKQNGYSKLLLTKEVEKERCVRGRTMQKQVWHRGSPQCREKIYSQIVVVITEINLSINIFDLHCIVPMIPRTNSCGMCQESCALQEYFTVTLHALSPCSTMAFLVTLFCWRNEPWQETLFLWIL